MKRRILSMVLALTMCAGALYGCGNSESDKNAGKEESKRSERNKNDKEENTQSVSMEDYEDSKAILLSAISEKWVPNYDVEEVISTKINVYYNGDIEKVEEYTQSGERKYVTTKLSDEEYEKVWNFVNDLNAGEFTDYNIDGVEDDTWSITSYDEDEKVESNFYGFPSDEQRIEDIIDMLNSYVLEVASIDVEVPAITGPVMDLGNESNMLTGEIMNSVTGFSLDFLAYEMDNTQDPDGNVIVSPMSAMYAVGMAAMGAEGDTFDEMAGVFCPGMTKWDMNEFLAFNMANSEMDDALTVSNSYWGNNLTIEGQGYQVSEEYLNLLRRDYAADCTMMDFDAAAQDTINEWVSNKTNGRIDGIIDEINPGALMYIINAMYFNGTWAVGYEDYEIDENGEFTNSKGDKETARMMYSTEERYYSSSLATGFAKSYDGGNYEFIAILPNDENMSMDEFVEAFDKEACNEFLASGDYQTVSAVMPAFEAEYKTYLDSMLQSMGMNSAYVGADFSAMIDDPDAVITTIVQKANITVDEKGTEAAAATSVMLEDSVSIEPASYEVVLNRPFMYMIMDNLSGTPIFVGVVNTVE